MSADTATPLAPAAPLRPSRWRDGMLWLLGSIVALVLGVNAVMIWLALAYQPNLVRRDYYDASRLVDGEQAARLASARLGWQAGADAARSRRDAAALRVLDAAGRPVSGLAGSVSAYRPSDAALDQPLAWQEDPAEPGLYRATFARPAAGLWRVELDVRRGAERLYLDLPIVLP
jgi:nitrogen fixation protein FixH